ncbi:hypothetical protein GCE86_25190 [Micromonospora terminaliae]|uniref:Uncharacterized protein n=1 Tax=Micromonospora terminaliae TaxID=1914461 RepID=A0AAJ3DKY4_9ACTN|nr:hypothetical protein [Micromonospora terminaliae]NES29793.1 hypothetical protein [Micromonospora terminaliae]QGL50021.1 hypothetical protein GCE86_25190 [Micromonospora terminaliae]
MTTPIDAEDRIVPCTPPRPARRHLPVALAALLALAGCGAPPELNAPTASVTTAPTASATPTPSATPAAPVTPTAPARTAPTPDPTATPCRSGPSGDRVVALLRGRAGVLPRDVRVTVRTGPLCAEGWQYTVLAVSGHEELQVVTRGRPTALELVTAGTDVCGVEVRAAGPSGIRTLACDGTPGA